MLILVLMTFSCGARSASTRPCASAATSTPEPALNEVMIFWALARLAAAAVCASVAAVLVLVLEVAAVVAIS